MNYLRIPLGPLVRVIWLDSQHDIGQVDREDLPNPTQLESVGHLAEQDEAHVVISRDRSPGPNSFEWRANLAIPRRAIVRIETLEVVPPSRAQKNSSCPCGEPAPKGADPCTPDWPCSYAIGRIEDLWQS